MTDSPLDTLADLVAERLDRRNVPAYAVTRQEAADGLSISLDQFEKYVQPELKLLRIGRRVLVPRVELDRYVERRSALTLGGDR